MFTMRLIHFLGDTPVGWFHMSAGLLVTSERIVATYERRILGRQMVPEVLDCVTNGNDYIKDATTWVT